MNYHVSTAARRTVGPLDFGLFTEMMLSVNLCSHKYSYFFKKCSIESTRDLFGKIIKKAIDD